MAAATVGAPRRLLWTKCERNSDRRLAIAMRDRELSPRSHRGSCCGRTASVWSARHEVSRSAALVEKEQRRHRSSSAGRRHLPGVLGTACPGKAIDELRVVGPPGGGVFFYPARFPPQPAILGGKLPLSAAIREHPERLP